MDNQSYRKMEQKKQTVLDAIQKSEGNIDFYGLKETIGMEAIELFSVVEALAKENRILMRLNHLDEGTYCYKSSGDVLYERFMDLLFAHHGKDAAWRSMPHGCVSLPNTCAASSRRRAEKHRQSG